MGARRNFSNKAVGVEASNLYMYCTDKNRPFFLAQKVRKKMFAIASTFKIDLKGILPVRARAKAEFCTKTAYNVITFKFHEGWAQLPQGYPLLQAPMHVLSCSCLYLSIFPLLENLD